MYPLYKNILINRVEDCPQGMLCIQENPSSVCHGDSGGPMVCNDTLYAVTSSIIVKDENYVCGDEGMELFVELYQYRKWMDKCTGKDKHCQEIKKEKK